jgi:hypothetical protein
LPPGLSTTPLQTNGNMPAGISVNGAAPPPGRTPTPGIPSAEQIKKGIKPSAKSTPGIPDPETIRKQLGYPPMNTPPKGDVMMKSNPKKPQ